MKPVILSLLVIFLAATSLHAQFTEDFSDANLDQAPAWFGDRTAFDASSGILQLNDQNAGSNNNTYLYTCVQTGTNTISWEFFFQLDFSPSGSNYANIILNADAPELDAAQNTFYLRTGGISGSDDALELYHATPSGETLILNGSLGAIGTSSVQTRVRIIRESNGDWTLEADYTGGTNFATEASANYTQPLQGQFFGFQCIYTSSRNDAFFLDDIIINGTQTDINPPSLLESTINTPTQIELIFNEPLNALLAQNTSLYNINNGIGNPTSVTINEDNPISLLLDFDNPLQNAVNYTLSINGLEDKFGNSANLSTDLIFYQVENALPGDLFITEFMPDPNPAIGLPEVEYFELFNASDKVIQLADVNFSTGGTPSNMNVYILLPGEYVIVCDDSDQALLEPFGPVAVMNSFPALTNVSGDMILSNVLGQIIESFSYDNTWYKNSEKDDGGFSLERSNVTGDPNCAAFWIASESPQGGTPGQENSVFGQQLDDQAPQITTVEVMDPFTVVIQFDEAVDVASAEMPNNYSIDPIIDILQATVQLPGRTAVLLELADMLTPSDLRTLTIQDAIPDCAGNLNGSIRTFDIVLTEVPEQGDIVINEVLFNPGTGGSDFIELYNKSDKYLNLNQIEISNTLKMQADIIDDDVIFPPQSYLVLTEDIDDIFSRYTIMNGIFLDQSIPSLDDKEGNVTVRLEEITLDSFDYFELYHFPLLDDKNGVSLERIDINGPSQGGANWHSAAQTAGFATPGYENSQTQSLEAPDDLLINIEDKTFSPNEDGDRDVLLMNYLLDDPGFVLNMKVFDVEGRLIRDLYNNEFLAIEGLLQWDGTNDQGQLANKGIYILWIELFQPDGTVKRSKQLCVLAK